jgi:hypothetical protein
MPQHLARDDARKETANDAKYAKGASALAPLRSESYDFLPAWAVAGDSKTTRTLPPRAAATRRNMLREWPS